MRIIILLLSLLFFGVSCGAKKQEIEHNSLIKRRQHSIVSENKSRLSTAEKTGEVARFRPETMLATPRLIQGLRLPEGFRVGVFAQEAGNARMMAVSDNGTVYVTRPGSGDVISLRDTNRDGVADSRSTVVSGLDGVHGIALRQGKLYLATSNTVYVAPIHANSDVGEPQPILSGLPPGGNHPYRTLGFGPDGQLYISVGSTCNACLEGNPETATLLRIEPSTGRRSIFAKGLRNTIGFGWHPQTGEMWGMDIGADWVGANIPPEELNNLSRGGDFGWPWCYGNRQIDPEMRKNAGNMNVEAYCAKTQPATLTYQAHSSPIGFAFYTGRQFPKKYHQDAFVALRGSWNRQPAVGYKVVRVDFEQGKPMVIRDFLTGFLIDGGRAHFARLAGVAVAMDGSLLISDDTNGIIYRVAYGNASR